MQMRILDKQKLLSSEAGMRIQKRFSKLSEMAGIAVLRVHIRVLDVNGPRGGEDKLAKVQVHVAGKGIILASARHRSLAKAVGEARNRVCRRLRELRCR